MKKSFHLQGKNADRLEQANSAMGDLVCWLFAFIVVVWLCHNTNAGIMTLDPQQAADVRSHHEINVLRSLGIVE